MLIKVHSNFNLGRFFKLIIYLTNHRRPEKDLLTKENIRQTLHLLADAFTQTDADLNVTHMISTFFILTTSLRADECGGQGGY